MPSIQQPSIAVDRLLKFQKGNAKLDKEVITFSLPAGYSCPGARECLSKADPDEGRLTDGPHTKFRCFAASQEAAFPSVRKSRWHNFQLLTQARSRSGMRDLILTSLSEKATKVRVHVSGDFFNKTYFRAWLDVAGERPDTLFYAYTKSLPFWADLQLDIPENFELTASVGGKYDRMIDNLQLRCAHVVFHPDDAKALGLEIDHDDSHAQGNDRRSFALLIHGQQPKGSAALAAMKRLKDENIKHSYGKGPRKK